MPVELSAQQRDALFAAILLTLRRFDELEQAIGQGDLESAYRRGREITDGLRLIADGGLGWAVKTAEPTTLTLPEAELRPIIGRMKAEADAVYENRRPDREETEREWAEVTDTRDACQAVLDQLD